MENVLKNDPNKLGKKEIGVLKVLFLFTCLMVFAPIFSYFALKSFVFEGFLGYENGSVSAAIGTVVVIHIIIAWYIWIAIKEERAEQIPVKKD